MPSRALILQNEKTALGFKAAKDEVTVVVCNASSWTERSELRMLVGERKYSLVTLGEGYF